MTDDESILYLNHKSCCLRQLHFISWFIIHFLQFRRRLKMSLAALRAKLQAQENRSQQNQQQSKKIGGDKSIFPHWNLTDGSSSLLRFLPDADSENVYFWTERQMIKLPFAGIKGQNENKEVVVQVPCIEMYGESKKCPLLAEVRTWYKDKSLEETANKYWKKRSYILQGFVRQNGLQDDETPENPIRRFIVTPQIFKNIKKSLLDPDFNVMPSDFNQGLDFKVIRTKNPGGYADWSTSDWAFMKGPTALTEAERAAIELHGLYNLRDFLPKEPSESELKIIKDLFEASVDGRMYDPDKWAAYYKPWGLQTGGSSSDDVVGEEGSYESVKKVSVPVSNPTQTVQKAASTVEDDSPPWDTTEYETMRVSQVSASTSQPASGSKTQDLLAMIRSRQNKPA